jgi:hypothetical protein
VIIINNGDKIKVNSFLIEKTIRNDIILLESDAKMLRMLREIEKVFLSGGAYSEKNIEKQNLQFDNANVPEWERNIVKESWNVKKKYIHVLFKRYSDIINKMEKHLNDFDMNIVTIKEKTPKDILKENLKDHVDSL